MYKAGINISNAQSSVFLFNCSDQDLRDDILQVHRLVTCLRMT